MGKNYGPTLKTIHIVDGFVEAMPMSYENLTQTEDPFVMLAWKCSKLESLKILGTAWSVFNISGKWNVWRSLGLWAKYTYDIIVGLSNNILSAITDLGYEFLDENLVAIARLRGGGLKHLEVPQICILSLEEEEEEAANLAEADDVIPQIALMGVLGKVGSEFNAKVQDCNCIKIQVKTVC